jgi:hypothetical protein
MDYWSIAPHTVSGNIYELKWDTEFQWDDLRLMEMR